MKIVLFDIDGTLLLTGGAGKLAFEEVFQNRFGIPNAWRGIHPDGRTDPFLIQELFRINLGRAPEEGEAREVRELYSRAMPGALQAALNFRLMPGVPEFLTMLSAQGKYLLGLATGNFEVTAWQKLERAGLRDYFSFGGFGSDHADRLELTRLAMERGFQSLGARIPSREIVLIGDTVHDIDCGKRLGMTTLAVATGSTPLGELEKAGAVFAIESLLEKGKWEEVFFREGLYMPVKRAP